MNGRSLNARSPLAVVVTADDFGIGRLTSEGIIQAHLHGPVTATSLMTITADHVLASVPLIAAGSPIWMWDCTWC